MARTRRMDERQTSALWFLVGLAAIALVVLLAPEAPAPALPTMQNQGQSQQM